MLATLAWQDEQLGQPPDPPARRSSTTSGQRAWWATLTNGDHGMARTATELADLERFYDHFLKGEDNGWDDAPAGAGVVGGRAATAPRAPGWITGARPLVGGAARRRRAARRPGRSRLRAGGALDRRRRRRRRGADTYAYVPVVGTQGIGNPYYALRRRCPTTYLWNVGPPPGTAAAFTTDAARRGPRPCSARRRSTCGSTPPRPTSTCR